MTKQEFLEKIKNGIKNLPKEDTEKYLQYYSEIIDDRIEEGMDESESVSAMGDVDLIISDILKDKNYSVENLEKTFYNNTKYARKERTKTLIIVLLTFPLWISLAAIVFSVAVSVFSVIIGLYATSFALGVSAIVCIALSVLLMFKGIAFMQILMILGGFLVCLGVAIILFIISHYFTKLIVKLYKKIFQKLKEYIKTKKEEWL